MRMSIEFEGSRTPLEDYDDDSSIEEDKVNNVGEE